ncbi:MAG: hypothetical protein HYX65_05650 [Gemmatimonadetes bacterium]|nr:hypothetical protein [Gemmatimonadota bacterium]
MTAPHRSAPLPARLLSFVRRRAAALRAREASLILEAQAEFDAWERGLSGRSGFSVGDHPPRRRHRHANAHRSRTRPDPRALAALVMRQPWPVNTAELAALVGISVGTMGTSVRKAVQAGLLVRAGARRDAGWVVTAKCREAGA